MLFVCANNVFVLVSIETILIEWFVVGEADFYVVAKACLVTLIFLQTIRTAKNGSINESNESIVS